MNSYADLVYELNEKLSISLKFNVVQPFEFELLLTGKVG